MSVTWRGRPVGLAEVDISDVSTARAVVAFVPIVNDDRSAWHGMPIGVLTWDDTEKTIELVFVNKDMRRQGLATAMLAHARRIDPDVKHSTDRSPDGTAWAKSSGDPVPAIKVRRSNKEAHAMGSDLMVALHGFTDVDVRGAMMAA